MERKNHNIVFLGKKGYGKTFKARLLSWSLERSIIFDPTNEFFGGLHFSDLEQFIAAVPYLRSRTNYRVVLKFKDTADYAEALEYIWDDSGIMDTTIIIDEIQNWAVGNSINPGLNNMLSLGRHRAISVWGIARRPYEMHRLITSQSDAVYSFKQKFLLIFH